MIRSNTVKKLESIARRCGASIEFEFATDESYIDAMLRLGEVELDVIMPRIKEDYLAYGLESDGLPRELYMLDAVSDQLRSTENLSNVHSLLSKRVVFHARPGVLKREKGYIVLSIDGKETKIPQTQNYFNLPIGDTNSKV